jgi:hypothetical protein
MTHVSLDTQDEAVKQFVLGLTVHPGGSVLELNGQPVVCVMPPAKSINGSVAKEEWNDAKNHRRCDLIDREFDGPPLTPEEVLELAELQEEMLRYRQQVAPLPLEEARRLQQALLVKAAQKPS